MARTNSKKRHATPSPKKSPPTTPITKGPSNEPTNKKKKNQNNSNSNKKASKKVANLKQNSDNSTNGVYKKTSPFKNSPIYDLLHTFEKAPDQWAARYIIILSAIILRAAIGIGPWSGKGQKPINGDFEAQRHWMEITTHLPLKQWYFYDLEYWGLDYPPLTAYHSWLCGKIGDIINSDWFAFYASRGIETSGIKTYMRWTSLISEMVIYIPALLQFIYIMGKKLNIRRMDQIVITAIVVNQPSLILIDHGHFQYNSVMLGFFLFALIDLLKGNLILASIWFISSILFKQMALYYSPFIFFYILSQLFTKPKHKSSLIKIIMSLNIAKLLLVGVTIIITIGVIVSPFIISPILNHEISTIPTLLQQILIRMFPFQRGLFEDKVANFWCTTNILVKYNQIFTAEQLQKLSLLATLLSILPPCLMAFVKNINKVVKSPLIIIYGFSACAWGFYLFSFQVHEKTVLVPLIPSTLLYVVNDGDMISKVQWINNVALFSMFPLLKKDGLVLQYAVSYFLINWLIGGFNLRARNNLLWPKSSTLWKLILSGSYAAMIGFHLIDFFTVPPIGLPDLWVILNIVISFGCFSIFYVWLLYRLYQL